MPEEDELAEKLLAADAVKSLQAERAVALTFQELGWAVSHGVYYDDPKTGKLREVDVLASERWDIVSDRGDTSVALNVVLECKSASGYHIVFSGTQPDRPYLLPMWWIGEDATALELFRNFAKSGFSDGEIADVRRNFFQDKWQNPKRVSDRPVRAAKAEYSGSNFKETNIGGEKELDNSVLWRSLLAVNSAISAFCVAESEQRALSIGAEANESGMHASTAVDRSRELLDYRELYHPVVVIGTGLWLLRDTEMLPIPWCRFELVDKSHGTQSWCDVVATQNVAAFAKHLTQSYDEEFRGRGARRLTELFPSA